MPDDVPVAGTPGAMTAPHTGTWDVSERFWEIYFGVVAVAVGIFILVVPTDALGTGRWAALALLGAMALWYALLGRRVIPDNRETWRGDESSGNRAAGTATWYLLEDGTPSRWHRIDAVEVWVWHGGSALELSVAPDGGAPERRLLGMDLARGEQPQAIVPAGAWQSARALGGWALVSCVVVPGFAFEHLEMAPDGWSPVAGGPDSVTP